MLDAIREIGIFIIIAQAVLYFVPGDSYVKYVKVIIGVIMIAMMARPILSFVTNGEWEEISFETERLWEALEQETAGFEAAGSTADIGEGIETELQNRLKEEPPSGFGVVKLEIEKNSETKEAEMIVVTLKAQEEAKEQKIEIEKMQVDEISLGLQEEEENRLGEEERKKLQEHCGRVLGTDASRIKIVLEG